MIRYLKYFAVLLGLTLFLGACATDTPETPDYEMPDTERPADNEDSDEDTDDADVAEDVTQDFEPQIEDTITLEGMEEPITLDLYVNEDAPFLTYYPTDLLAEEASSGEGDAYFFYANFQEVRLDDIYLEVYFFDDDVTTEPSPDDGSTFAERVENMEEVPGTERWYDWSITEYQSSEGSDQVMLGEHEGIYFFMHINSEVMYSEGFVPRANKVIEHFFWKDTQTYLVDR